MRQRTVCSMTDGGNSCLSGFRPAVEDQAVPTDVKSPTVLEEADLVAPAEGRGMMKSGIHRRRMFIISFKRHLS